MFKLLLSILILAMALVAHARNPKTGEGMMRPLCEQFAAKKRTLPGGQVKKPWIDVDTIRWNERFVPEFREIVGLAKGEAIKNQSFKASFVNTPTRSYTAEEVDQQNLLRLQSECGNNTEQMFNCTHFRADCAMQMSTNVLTDALRSFSECAMAPVDNKFNHLDKNCGDSWKTPAGVKGNLDALDKAVKEIDKLKDEIGKNPGLSEYFSDVERAYAELHDLYEKALAAKAAADVNFANLRADAEARDKLASGVISDFDRKKSAEYDKQLATNANFRKAVDVLNKCDDYLDKKGYEDKHQVIAQINICQMDVGPATEPEIQQFSGIMEHLEEQNKRESLKNVAIAALENSAAMTVTEFANLFKAMTGKAPTLQDVCAKLDATFCQNPTVKSTLKALGDVPNVPKMNMQAEIQGYNQAARDMHKLCQEAARTPDKRLVEGRVQQQLTKIMYSTRVGQLMGFKKFRDAIGGPFDSDACLKGNPGFKLIPETPEGLKLFSDATWKILDLQKDKSKQIRDYTNQVGYHGKYLAANDADYEKLLRNLLENDPFTVREAIRGSGDPDQALWLCHATADIYRREKRENVWKWIGTGLCIAGSLAATVFTFGAATPLLIGSIAMGAGIGVYNLNQAWTQQHNHSMSAAISSSDPIINSYALKAADDSEKAAYVEIGLSMLPAFMKGAQLGGKALAPLISKTPMVANALKGGAQAYAKLGAGGKAIIDAMKKGQKITVEMLQKGLGEKFANAGGKGMVMVGDFLRGAAPDAAMEFMTALAIHPDPLSEDSIRSMIMGVGFGSSMRLGSKGLLMLKQKYQANFNQVRTQINITTTTSPEVDVPVTNVQNNTGISGLQVQTSTGTRSSTYTTTSTGNVVYTTPTATNTHLPEVNLPTRNVATTKTVSHVNGDVPITTRTKADVGDPGLVTPENNPDGSWYNGYQRLSAKVDGKEVGMLSYDINDGVLEIGWSKVDPAHRGKGYQNDMFDALFIKKDGKTFVKKYDPTTKTTSLVEVKQIRTSLDETNQGSFETTLADRVKAKMKTDGISPKVPDEAVIAKMKRSYGRKLDQQVEEGLITRVEADALKLKASPEEELYRCCADYLAQLKPEERLALFDDALTGTPAWKTRKKFGFDKFGEHRDYHFKQNKDGSLSFKVEFEVVPNDAVGSKPNTEIDLPETTEVAVKELKTEVPDRGTPGDATVIEVTARDNVVKNPPVTKPPKSGARIDYSKLGEKERAYYTFVKTEPIKTKIPLTRKYTTGEERLAEWRGTSARDVKYQTEKGDLVEDFGGGEAKIFQNPNNKDEAIKIWKDSRADDFELSVRAVQVTDQRVSQNPVLKKYIEVSKIKEKGKNYIIKEFNQNSTELKHMLSDPDVKIVIRDLKVELGRKNDTFNQKLLQGLTRTPPSSNLHWDPVQKKVLIIDALGF